MEKFSRGIPKDCMRLFSSDIGVSEYFSYVGNMVTLEQAISVTAIMFPDFIEREGCVFWRPNVDEYDPKKFPMKGFKNDSHGNLCVSFERRDIERYCNNFPVSQFFHKWEDYPDKIGFKVDLGEEDYKLCHVFAGQIVKYWRIALFDCFPYKNFEFEISDNILDEYGVCLTFWQSD